MEVVVPIMGGEFNFDSACTTPYVSAPSSPRGFGYHHQYYTSAPTSPSRAAAIYNHFRTATSSSSVIPFDWEDTPGTPKYHRMDKDNAGGGDEEEEEEDKSAEFAFKFSGQQVMGADESLTATADELFEAGKIRPLKPPPRLQVFSSGLDKGGAAYSPKSPKSPKSPRSRLFWSPRHRGKQEDDFDPFAKAIEETTRGRNLPANSSVLGSRRAARSLSPLRGGFNFGGDGKSTTTNNNTTTTATGNYGKGGSKKWRLKDFFLFRSASEGRATATESKDPLRKYTAMSPKLTAATTTREDTKNSSFRSTDSGSVGGSSRRGRVVSREGSVSGGGGGSVGGSSRRGVSPHEMHYTANRAVSEEQKRKTFLPYRQGLLGCLGFNPAIHGLAKGFGSVASGGHRRS